MYGTDLGTFGKSSPATPPHMGLVRVAMSSEIDWFTVVDGNADVHSAFIRRGTWKRFAFECSLLNFIYGDSM